METRRAPRTNVQLKVIFQLPKEREQKFSLSKGNTFEVNIVDISVGGMGVFSKYFLPKGLIIETQIEGKPFDLNEPMKIRGEIRFCSYAKSLGYRCGVMFLDISNEYKKIIADFIATYERRKEPRYNLPEYQ